MNLFGVSIIIIAAIVFAVYLNKKYIAEYKSKEDKSSTNVFIWKSIGTFLLVVLIVNVAIGATSSNSAGEGKVNLFPEGAYSKNYRVDAWLVRSDNYLPLVISDTYELTNVYWGDDGGQDVEVSGCYLKKGQQKSCDVGEGTYVTEIAELGCISNGPDECD